MFLQFLAHAQTFDRGVCSDLGSDLKTSVTVFPFNMEESVLLGTKPLVDSIHHFIDPGPEWRIFRMSPL